MTTKDHSLATVRTCAGAALIGPAGVGETTLAREAAERLAPDFPRVDERPRHRVADARPVRPVRGVAGGARDRQDRGSIHTAVSAGLGSLTAGAPGPEGVAASHGTIGPGPEGVAASHGTIAYGVDTALTAALGSRTGSMNVTQSSGAHISELLHQAAMAYERGDQRGAATSAAPGSSAGGTDALGQTVGQLGQMGQQLGAPLAALAQPLQQLSQQIMQGVQQMTQSTTQATESDKSPVPDPDADRRPEPSRDEQPPTEAAPGAQVGSGVAPVAPGGRQEPAPTRPSSD